MKLTLAENIRVFRKQRKMTQEQLAELLGVTVGAVYKWESGLSIPELNLIVEMADFFDVSVDVLLGYEMKDNRLKSTVSRLEQYISTEDPEGLPEAEKALKRFPHSFDVVFLSAVLFMLFGGKDHDGELLNRASVLLEQALALLPQNTNPMISEISIYEYLANVRIMQGHGDQAAELLKKHNREGVYNDQIGMTLSLICKRPEEAQPYLSEALIMSVSSLVQTVLGKAYAFSCAGDQDSAENLLLWCIRLMDGLKQSETTGYPDQTCAYLYTLLSYVRLKKCCPADAEENMITARDLAKRFDESPNYDARSFRFIGGTEHYHLHYMIGRTAEEGVAYIVRLTADENLAALRKKVFAHE